MRTNMWARIICAGFAILSFGGAMFFHFCYREIFFYDLCLAIFGSSLLAYIIAFISYRVAKREAVMQYLADLRRYRRKHSRIYAMSADSRRSYLEDLSDFFYELCSDYAKIQHLCVKFFSHRQLSLTLNQSFQNVINVQGELNCSHFDRKQCNKIDEAVDAVEKLAIEEKYLFKSEDVKDGQT